MCVMQDRRWRGFIPAAPSPNPLPHRGDGGEGLASFERWMGLLVRQRSGSLSLDRVGGEGWGEGAALQAAAACRPPSPRALSRQRERGEIVARCATALFDKSGGERTMQRR